MWTVIYIAQSDRQAEHIKARLIEEGFLAKLRQTNVSRQQYEILVPEAELEEIEEIINDIIHEP